MIKFFRYSSKYRSPLRILTPPFNAEDFEIDSFSPNASIWGGLTKVRKGNEVKIAFQRIHYTSINLRDEEYYPKRSTPGHGCTLWFTSEADVKRFIQENRDIILDLSEKPYPPVGSLKSVTEKWSYYILKYQ